MDLPKKSFVGTEICGLCRLQLPWANLSGRDAWQCNFRAVLCLESNGENAIELTNLASFANVYNNQLDVPLTGNRRIEVITIIHRPQDNQKMGTDQVAFCFHDWCYSILMWNVGGCTKSEIYKLARTLTPNPAIWENTFGDRDHLNSISNKTLRWLAEKSPPVLHPFFMSQLPAELRHSIWEYVGLRTASNAFTLVTHEASRLASSLNSSRCCNMLLDRGSYISPKMITVFGIEYIQNLDNGDGSKVIPGVVTSLKFATILGGICAIKLLGIDWDMGWLGKIPDMGCIWYGTIEDTGSGLNLTSNDLYCVHISRSGPSSNNQVLWDQPGAPSISDPDTALFDFDRDIIGSSRPILHTQPQYLRYLPLYSGNEYIKGLTVYLSGNGIIGLEAHFTQTSQLSGSCNGCAKYFPLDPSERIAYAWLRIVNSRSPALAAPTLTIQTTFDRIYSFGPYILPHLVRDNRYKWILLESQGYITGFFYENSVTRPVIMRLGALGDENSNPKVHLIPKYPACHIPYLPLVGPNSGLFLSVAVLSGLKKVEVCRVANRCTGMMIHYLNALPIVLGQWHTSHPSQHTCIYDSNGLRIDTIYFGTSKSGDHQIVTDVSFSADKAVSDCNYQAFRAEEPIAWWFSKLDDVICPWEGDFLAIPKESIVRQK